MSKSTKRAWENKYLTGNTEMYIYQACVLSSLLYGSETSTTYMRREHLFNSFHLLRFRRILGVKSPTARYCNVLIFPVCTPSSVSAALDGSDMFIGWVTDASPINGQLTAGVRKVGLPILRFMDAC